ncbi:MAG: hypothetical protein ACK413_02350 [Patescibacteria group bacterium]
MGRNRSGLYLEDIGIIALHDIMPGSKECVGRVPQFWKEIKDRYDSKEMVKSWGQEDYGIGLIYDNKNFPITDPKEKFLFNIQSQRLSKKIK